VALPATFPVDAPKGIRDSKDMQGVPFALPLFLLSLFLSPLQAQMDSLVILEAAGGKGSGFLMEEKGQMYVVSNLHVLMSGLPEVTLLDGRKLKAGKLWVSEERDLGRVEVSGENLKGLSMRQDSPELNSPVEVNGNSDGAGVVTHLKGKVLGVGPDLLEVDAPFVQGNSGSPILDKQGRVLAVASYATMDRDPGNWLKEDSRFGKIRRFGYRLNGVTWKEMSWDALGKRVRMLEDMERFCYELFLMRYSDAFRDETGLLQYDVREGQKRFIENKQFANWMSTLTASYNREAERYLNSVLDEHHGPAARAQRHTRELRMSTMNQDARQRAEWAEVRKANEKIDADNKVRALNHVLLNDEEFQASSAIRQVGPAVRARLVHDAWGSEFLKERADKIYATFLGVVKGEIRPGR